MLLADAPTTNDCKASSSIFGKKKERFANPQVQRQFSMTSDFCAIFLVFFSLT